MGFYLNKLFQLIFKWMCCWKSTEKKDLQIKTQSIKRKVPKGDKKREKEAKKEILALENELKDRHAAELQNMQAAEATVAGMQDLNLENQTNDSAKPIKMSKAQRRRK